LPPQNQNEEGSSEDLDAKRSVGSNNILTRDITSVVSRIFQQDPGRAGYELAGIIYELLDQRNKTPCRKSLSWLTISLFLILDETGWDEVAKGTFLLAFALRWKKGHEHVKTEFHSMLDKLDQLEAEMQRLSRREEIRTLLTPGK